MNALKWWQTIKISMVNQTTYRLNFVLQIIGPSLVFFFVKYNLWSSIYSHESVKEINGFDLEQMISYHVWALIVSLISQGHGSWNLSEDIRMGRISNYLIYPFDFWEFHSASFIGFQIIQFFISIITIFIFTTFNLIDFSILNLSIGMIYCFYISIFWFLLQYLTGLLAFWLEETWILRVILQIITVFLSGAIIPLDLYPNWIREILVYTPFPYLTYYSIKIFQGELHLLWQSSIVILAWSIVIFIICQQLWKRGMKHYTGAGM